MEEPCTSSIFKKSNEIIDSEQILVATNNVKIEDQNATEDVCCRTESHELPIDLNEIKLEIDDVVDEPALESSTLNNENGIMEECLEIKIEKDDSETIHMNAKENFTNILFRQDEAFANGISRETIEKESLMEAANLIVKEEKDRRDKVSKVKKRRNFECQECGKFYKTKYSLKNHQRIHIAGSDTFQCKECGRCFPRLNELRLHEKTHRNSKKNFECEECGKCFTLKGNLKQHLGTHSDYRPFQCTVCGKGFKFRSNLIEHCRLHFGFKPFKCKECGKSYRTSTHLKSHSKTHSKDKVDK